MFKLFCFLMVHKLNVQPKRWKVIGKSYLNDQLNDIFNKTIKMSPEGYILSEIEPWLD
jgi:hypothetical protein